MKRYVMCIYLLFSLFAPSTLVAAWHATASLSESFDNNALRSSLDSPDAITEATLLISHNWKTQTHNVALTYAADITYFADFNNNNALVHSFEVSSGIKQGDNGWLSGGIQAEQRVNRDENKLLDYRDIGFYIDSSFPHTKSLKMVVGYSLHKRSYNIANAFNNIENQLYAQLQQPFTDGTMLLLNNELGYKLYDSASFENDGKASGQWIATVRLSRPLLERLGIMLYARNRMNFADNAVVMQNINTATISETDLYDDHYAYESIEYGSMLSHQLARQMILRAGYDYANKQYQQTALDSNGILLPTTEHRNDKKSRLWCKLEKKFTPSLQWYSMYEYYNNNSNDAFYCYSASIFTTGITMML